MIWGNSVYTEGSPATAQPSTGTTERGIRWVPGGLACAPLTHELSCIFLSAPPPNMRVTLGCPDCHCCQGPPESQPWKETSSADRFFPDTRPTLSFAECLQNHLSPSSQAASLPQPGSEAKQQSSLLALVIEMILFNSSLFISNIQAQGREMTSPESHSRSAAELDTISY